MILRNCLKDTILLYQNDWVKAAFHLKMLQFMAHLPSQYTIISSWNHTRASENKYLHCNLLTSVTTLSLTETYAPVRVWVKSCCLCGYFQLTEYTNTAMAHTCVRHGLLQISAATLSKSSSPLSSSLFVCPAVNISSRLVSVVQETNIKQYIKKNITDRQVNKYQLRTFNTKDSPFVTQRTMMIVLC